MRDALPMTLGAALGSTLGVLLYLLVGAAV